MINVDKLASILPTVRKPSRYIGQEWNAINKDRAGIDASVVLAYPDVYEIGMSNLGLNILYEIINGTPYALAERVYTPWPDMEEALMNNQIPLYSLESKTPLGEFDIIGFTLQHEMNYTNILTMLDLAGVPLLSRERTDSDPLVIAGGPCAFNPEPMADFIDAFVIGDGEDVIVEILDVVRKRKGTRAVLEDMSEIRGVYVPSYKKTTKRCFVDALEGYPAPTSPVVPYAGVIHDRYAVEIMRGCTRSCRFCQAGMIYRPVRERSAESIKAAAEQGLIETGHNDLSLVSLSSSDHSNISTLTKDLSEAMRPSGVSVSLPSLRMDSFSVSLAATAKKSHQASLTFAPEAGTQRMRDIINKNITDEDIKTTLEAAFQEGFTKVKLYFMIGLPHETNDDLGGIVDMAYGIRKMALDTTPRKMHNRVTVTVNVAAFIPKPNTPFQWTGQESLESLDEKIDYLKKRLRNSHMKFKWHDTRMAVIEAALSRGGREVGEGILAAWRNGCRFDSWDEELDFDKWERALSDSGIDIYEYAGRTFDLNEDLPWDIIECGVSKDFLKSEYYKASEGSTTPDCRIGPCASCGLSCKRSE